MCTRRRLGVLFLVVSLAPAGASAQSLPEGPITTANGTVTVTGEVAATFGARDHKAYFNYTDYEHNALRMLRLSLAGMWRPTEQIAFLTEFRSEDTEHLIPYAMYARVRPFKGHNFDIQAGRIPPVFGAFARRSYGSDRMLIGLPLAYQYLTSLRADAIPTSTDDLLARRGSGWLTKFPVGVKAPGPGVPIVSSYRWDTGIQAHVGTEYVEGAVDLAPCRPRVVGGPVDGEARQVGGESVTHLHSCHPSLPPPSAPAEGYPRAPRLCLATSGPTGTSETTTMTPMIGSRYRSTFGTVLPSTKPASVTPPPQRTPPTALATVNCRTGIRATPAAGLRNVRTTGTKRASTTAWLPPRSKNASARST